MYIVLEIQKNENGTVGIISTQYESREEALQKYYQICSYAVVSKVQKHSAMIVTDDAMVFKSECFNHEELPIPEVPEEEPEEEVEEHEN